MSSTMEDDVETVGTSRSRRRESTTNKTSSRMDALTALREARKSGKVFRHKVDNLISDVYVEVDENDYAMKKNEERAFVEDDDGNGYVDESSEDDELEEKEEKKPAKAKIEKKKKGGIVSMFQSLKNKKDESLINLNDDGILTECLAGLNCDLELQNETESETHMDESAVNQSSIEYDISLRNPFKRVASPISAPRPIKLSRNANVSEIKFQQKIISHDNANELESNVNVSVLTKPHSSSNVNLVENQECRNAPIGDTKLNETIHSNKSHFVHSIPEITNVDNSSFGQSAEISDDDFNVSDCPPSTDDKNVVRFYYLDAFEDAVKHPGSVYLFGRIQAFKSTTFESCCIVVKNVMRQIFFLKREPKVDETITDDMLRLEVREILQRDFGITKFKSKVVEKKFLSRESSLPNEGTALEVWINFNFGRIPANLSGKTFSHVFNTTTTALERIVVECGIKGPCWLEVSDAVSIDFGVSHCRVEYDVNLERMKSIRVLANSSKMPVPPIGLLSLNILTALNQSQNEQQIVMISMLNHTAVSMECPQFDRKYLTPFCIVTKLNKGLSLPFDFIDKLKKRGMEKFVKEAMDERVLLNMFLCKISQINPDMIVAHDWPNQLSILVARMKKYQLRNWHLISRLKRKILLNKLGQTRFVQWELTCGRLCLDSKSAAEELVRSRSYEMEDLVEQVLKPTDSSISRVNISMEQIMELFTASSSKIELLNVIEWNWTETLFCLRILGQLNAIPLFLQITQIVGGIFSRTLMGGRSERNEFLLLHACHKNQFVAPDKYFSIKSSKILKNSTLQALNESQLSDLPIDDKIGTINNENNKPKLSELNAAANKKSQYTGGLVLEPKKGLYESFIVLLDFNSLYPSIIQEYNICFTTVPNAFADVDEIDLPKMPGDSKPEGILKAEIRELVNRRREVKNLMKKVDTNSVLYNQYNIRQVGLKLTANSMYGCLGFVQSRFYAKTLAAMVTSKGREILIHTRDLVQAEGFSVIYGDTDSIMVNTNSTDLELAKNVGLKLKQIVNKNYRLLELDIDGIYKKLLLLKKKKYAALSVDLSNENIVKREIKGLDIVRRDWSVLAKEIGDEVVTLILSSTEREVLVDEILQLLSSLRKNLDNKSVDMAKFEILKQLTRHPSEYHDTKSQPHVQVAMRLNETKKFCFKQGDIIKYVICNDCTSNPATQRGYHIFEVLSDSETLSIDIIYYLTQQVHPVVSRLCEPIEEIDAVQIAEALGIDSTSYHRRLNNPQLTTNEEDIEFGLDQEFGACEGFIYECEKCDKLNIIRNIISETNTSNEIVFSLEKCANCSSSLATEQPCSILNCLLLSLRAQVEKHIQSLFVCDDVTCNAECLLPAPHQWTTEGCVCFKCNLGIMHKTYSSKQLFDQQCFFKTIFDLDAYLNTKCNREIRKKLLAHSTYNAITEIYRKCLTIVERYLLLNDFNKVNLAVVFAPLFSSKLSITN